jgi:hypothetical protein
MVKRRIPVSNKQVNETKLIDSLNSKLLKKEGGSVKALKKRFPGMEKTIDSFVNVLEETLAEAENKPAADIPQDVLDGLNTEAVDAYECGTEIAEDSAPNFDKIESNRQREIKYNAHADKIGYADAGPSPVWHNTMVFKDLSPEALEKLEKVIGPVAKSILERFDHNKNTLKDNEECRKAVNSEVVHTDMSSVPSGLTDYGKKVFEAGRRIGKMAIEGKETGKIVVGKDSAYEMVNHPTHYNQYDIEVIDMIIRIWGPEAAALWCDITAFKYRMRMGTKPDNSIEQDIKKEQWYLNKSKEIRENLINKN